MFQWLMVQTQVRIAQWVRAGAGVPMVDGSTQVRIAQWVRAEAGVPMVDGSNPGQNSSVGYSWGWCSNGRWFKPRSG